MCCYPQEGAESPPAKDKMQNYSNKIVTPKLPKIKHVYQTVIYVTMTVSIERQLWGCCILVEGDNVYVYAYLIINKKTLNGFE